MVPQEGIDQLRSLLGGGQLTAREINEELARRRDQSGRILVSTGDALRDAAQVDRVTVSLLVVYDDTRPEILDGVLNVKPVQSISSVDGREEMITILRDKPVGSRILGTMVFYENTIQPEGIEEILHEAGIKAKAEVFDTDEIPGWNPDVYVARITVIG